MHKHPFKALGLNLAMTINSSSFFALVPPSPEHLPAMAKVNDDGTTHI
jgi:hypothetical protein